MTYEIPSPAYEQACLEAVRDILLENEGLRRDGIEVHSVDLMSKDDKPLIVASFTRRGQRRCETWHLYEDAFSGIPPPGRAEPPEGVATQMWVWVMGG